MRHSSKNSRESTSKEIDKVVKEDEGRKLQRKSKNTACSKEKTGLSTGAYKVRKSFVARKRRL